MNVMLYQSHSANNEALFMTTIRNHLDYCARHGYSLILKDEPYRINMPTDEIGRALKLCDMLITIGSDCVFTDMKKPITDFWNGKSPVAICIEGSPETLVNGEITFLRNSRGAERFLDVVAALQQQFPNEKWGYQSIVNRILAENPAVAENVQLIEAGTLQRYFGSEWENPLCTVFPWNPGDFLAHCFNKDNESKRARCFRVLQQMHETTKEMNP